MDLTNAVALFKKLKATISNHTDYLMSHESVTRILLVDPVLEILGWDVREPNLVQLEFKTATQKQERADYLLKHDSQDLAIVETKRYNPSFNPNDHREQGNRYATDSGVAFFVLTDGARWALYKREVLTPLENLEPIVDFNIMDDNPTRCALNALSMWMPNLASGDPDSAGTPLFGTGNEQPDALITNNPSVSPPEPDEQEGRISSQTITESNTEPGWISLKDLPEVNNKQPKPKHIKFPEGQAKKFRRASSVGVLRETAKWLINNGKLKTEDAQVPHPEVTNRYVTSSREQLHPSGQLFREPESVGANVYIEKDWTAQHCIDGALALLEHCGVDPNTIQVSFDRV